MNTIIKQKKYFIKDSELKTIEEDRLNQKDVVKNLNLIIDNTKPPFNVALTGKWGIGKSSIINLLLNKYKNDTENYNIEKINVWKEKTSIKTILDAKFNKIEDEYNKIEINNANYNTENNEQNINQNSNIENENEKTVEQNSKNKTFNLLMAICNTVIIFVASLFITSIIFVILEYFQNRSIYKSNHVFFVENTYLNYCENLGAIIIFSIILTIAGLLLSKVGSKKKKNAYSSKYEIVNGITYEKGKSANLNVFETNYKSSYQNRNIAKTEFNNEELDSLNEELHNNLENGSVKSNNDNKKNIIIIEDIDKLSTTKMLSTIEEIKHCNEYENCICIVPFDLSILKKAIEMRNNAKFNGNAKPVNMDLVLDKLFQFKVNVPRICGKSVKDFAVSISQETIPNFIAEYCPIEKFEKVIRYVLIYKNVTTPRHVKKLINNFVNNKIISSYRVQNGKIDKNFASSNEFDFALAKISVIQSDFYEFYNVLFKDANYLNELTELYCLDVEELKEKYNEVDDNLKPFLSSKYTALRNFLKQTKRFDIDDVETFLYLTRVETEKMFGDKSVLSYIKGDEDIISLTGNDVLKLVQLIDKKEDLKEFTENNFEKILQVYNNNADDVECFKNTNELVNVMKEYVDEQDYLSYLELVANNYNAYPAEALQLFKNVNIEIPGNIMVVLFERIKENLSSENYDDSFEILKENSEPFYEENGNISEYVQFLVNNIGLASNPNMVIEELDENFTRIGRVYELNRNIKGLSNLDYDKAYSFMAKCLDNGDLDRMVIVMNSILSDDDVPAVEDAISENALINDCLSIEERMDKYNLVDVVEYNVDSLIEKQQAELSSEEENVSESVEIDGGSLNNVNILETSKDSKQLIDFENINYALVKNLIEISAIKQEKLNPVDVMKLVEIALSNVSDTEYLYSVYAILKKFDRMYFYDIRRDFNEVIYSSFHSAKKNSIKEKALECTRYFKNTRLFKTKLTPAEEKFYNAN